MDLRPLNNRSNATAGLYNEFHSMKDIADIDTECKNSPACAPAKHHFDHCVERVQQQESEGGAKEDCVEECTCQL